MARQTTVRLTDDLDGSDAQTTVRFGWDGATYEIDLTSEHAEAFTAAVRPYLEAARRVGPERRTRRNATTGRGPRSARGVGEQAVIREWAREHGFELADRGRIPRRVLDAYQAGQQNGAPTGSDPAPSANRTRSAPTGKATSKRAAASARPAAKATGSKSTAKKATAKKTTAKKATAKKTSARKTAAKTTTAKTVVAKKAAAKKTSARKPTRAPRAAVKE